MKQPVCVDEEYARFLLGEAQDAQTRFWNTLSALESQLNVELNSTKDLEHLTIDRLLVDPEMWESSSVPEPARIFDNRELSTMLHSLRLLQGALRNGQNHSCLENGICDHMSELTMLSQSEIDDLCERLSPA
jgi:hypothetical protein